MRRIRCGRVTVLGARRGRREAVRGGRLGMPGRGVGMWRGDRVDSRIGGCTARRACPPVMGDIAVRLAVDHVGQRVLQRCPSGAFAFGRDQDIVVGGRGGRNGLS